MEKKLTKDEQALQFLFQNNNTIQRMTQERKDKQRQEKREEKAQRQPAKKQPPKKQPSKPVSKQPSKPMNVLQAGLAEKRVPKPVAKPVILEESEDDEENDPSYEEDNEEDGEKNEEEVIYVPRPSSISEAEADALRSLVNVFDIEITGCISAEKLAGISTYLTDLIKMYNTKKRRKQLVDENALCSDDEDEGDEDSDAVAERDGEDISNPNEDEEEEEDDDEDDSEMEDFIAPEGEVEYEESYKRKKRSQQTHVKRPKKQIEVEVEKQSEVEEEEQTKGNTSNKYLPELGQLFKGCSMEPGRTLEEYNGWLHNIHPDYHIDPEDGCYELIHGEAKYKGAEAYEQICRICDPTKKDFSAWLQPHV